MKKYQLIKQNIYLFINLSLSKYKLIITEAIKPKEIIINQQLYNYTNNIDSLSLNLSLNTTKYYYQYKTI